MVLTEAGRKYGDTADLECVYAYHKLSKHHPHQYAQSLGYLDWDSQPDPFRHYDQSPTLALEHPQVTDTPTYDSLFSTTPLLPAAVNLASIGCLFYESLAISAWKKAGSNQWSLRVNPSSGDLHPTEAYLLAGPIHGLSEVPAVYHYSAYQHALEQRLTLTHEEWSGLGQDRKSAPLYVALTSIYWRESWKYGERAYRYCHHDVGHAIAAVSFAAAVLGWQTRLIQSLPDEPLATLLGLNFQEGFEAEHPDCLLAIYPADQDMTWTTPVLDLPIALRSRLAKNSFTGHANRLSRSHYAWPVIDDVATACEVRAGESPGVRPVEKTGTSNETGPGADRNVPARKIIRNRRSAVAMDGHTHISKATFYRMLAHLTAQACHNRICAVLPWPARIALAIFVHRVEDLPSGLYLLVRDPDHEPSLRKALHPEFLWLQAADCPQGINLYLLTAADFQDTAHHLCCHQPIAADGAFALAMLADFTATLAQYGASSYPRLFWETGLIGQILYLEAEAAGIRATGIGCFFDDAMHDLLGIHDASWQSLYHFTVGGYVDDPRIQTLPAYWHVPYRMD